MLLPDIRSSLRQNEKKELQSKPLRTISAATLFHSSSFVLHSSLLPILPPSGMGARSPRDTIAENTAYLWADNGIHPYYDVTIKTLFFTADVRLLQLNKQQNKRYSSNCFGILRKQGRIFCQAISLSACGKNHPPKANVTGCRPRPLHKSPHLSCVAGRRSTTVCLPLYLHLMSALPARKSGLPFSPKGLTPPLLSAIMREKICCRAAFCRICHLQMENRS